MGYISSANFASYLGISISSHATEQAAAISAATAAIDGVCGRSFATNTSSVTTRTYVARYPHRLDLDDFSTTTGLTVTTDEGDNGTYNQAWTITTDFTVHPPGPRLGDLPWAFNEIRATGTRWFPISGSQRPRVQIAAAFGWPATPDAIIQACYELALDIFKMKDSPFGVAGFNEYGVVRVRENRVLSMLLQPFVRRRALV